MKLLCSEFTTKNHRDSSSNFNSTSSTLESCRPSLQECQKPNRRIRQHRFLVPPNMESSNRMRLAVQVQVVVVVAAVVLLLGSFLLTLDSVVVDASSSSSSSPIRTEKQQQQQQQFRRLHRMMFGTMSSNSNSNNIAAITNNGSTNNDNDNSSSSSSINNDNDNDISLRMDDTIDDESFVTMVTSRNSNVIDDTTTTRTRQLLGDRYNLWNNNNNNKRRSKSRSSSNKQEQSDDVNGRQQRAQQQRQNGGGGGDYNTDNDVPYGNEHLHDMDCAQFEGWDDVPLECQGTIWPTNSPTTEVFFVATGEDTSAPLETSAPIEGDSSTGDFIPIGGNGPSNESESLPRPEEGVSSPVAAPTDDSNAKFPDKTTTPSNIVSLHFSMAIIHLGYLSDDEANLIVTMCLRAVTDTLNTYSTFNVTDFLSPPSTSNNGRSVQEEEEDGGGDTVAANLFLHDAQIGESDQMQDWFVVTATYLVFRLDGDPVVNSTRLDAIATSLDEVLTIAMEDGTYRASLEALDFGQDLLMDMENYTPDDYGLVDSQAVGHEYDISQEGGEESGMDSTTNGTASREDPMFDPVTEPTLAPTHEESNTHDTVLGHAASDVVWMTREWVGLGMMSATILFSVLLSVIAMRLQQTKTRDQIWGTILTEEGVGELLHVGWRYHQGTASPDERNPTSGIPHGGGGGGQQLFLQIYDKANVGYSDDNSMLQGGVDR
jgi:hypothetical protein